MISRTNILILKAIYPPQNVTVRYRRKRSSLVRTITPFRNSTPCNPHTGKPLSWIDPLLLSRGEDFPGYTHPISLPNTQEDRVTRIQNSELAYRPLAFLKHSFPNKSQWDGNISPFRAYKHEMEGFYIQNKGRFMFDPIFRNFTVNSVSTRL